MNPDLIAWLANGERGISSETIVEVLTDTPCSRGWGRDHPADPDDLWRCERLLRAVPLLRVKFPLMASVSPQWAGLVKRWDELVKLLEEESGGVEYWSAPKTYKAMQEILHPEAKP